MSTRTVEVSSTPTIIVVGPPPTLLGGMASVVGQILALDFAGRYRLKLLETTFSPGDGESLSRRILRHVRQSSRLRGSINGRRASLVHIHACSGFSFLRATLDMLAAQASGCRVVLHIHGAAFDVYHAQAGRLGRGVISWSLTRADRVVALSNGWRDRLWAMAPRARVVVIENAVEVPAVVPVREGEGPCRFLLLARMDDWKGIDDLLEACAKLTAAGTSMEVILAGPPGSAGDAAALNGKIETHDLHTVVRYVGPVQGEQKVKLLHETDVYLQPSHHEGMPVALLEAIAHGLPVVATRVGAVPEVITDGVEGLLVPPQRPDLLAEAMGELTANRQRRLAMSQAARELALSRFGLTRLRDDLLALYDGLNVADRGPAPAERMPFEVESPFAADQRRSLGP